MPFVMLLIFLLIYYIRPQDFLPYLLEERLVFITLGLCAVVWAISLLYTRKRIFRSPHSIFMVGLWFAAVLSTYYVKWQQYTLDVFIYFGKVTLIYYLASEVIDSQRKIKVFFWFFVLACGVLGAFGILQHYGIDITNVGLRAETKIVDGVAMTTYRIRGAGIFDTNQLAYTMGLVLPLAFVLFRITRFIFGKILLIAMMCVYGMCVFLTQSRGGMLAFLVPLFLLVVLRGRLGGRFLTIVLACLVLFSVISSSERFSTIFQYRQDKSAMARLDAWYAGSLIFRTHPIIGVGIDQFREAGKQYGIRIVSHNGFVQAAAETGLLGLFFWSGLLYFTFKFLNRLQPKQSKTNNRYWQIEMFARGLTIAFIQYLIACFFSGDAFDFTIYLMVALVVAVESVARTEGLIEPLVHYGPLISRRDIVGVFGTVGLILMTWKLSMTIFL